MRYELVDGFGSQVLKHSERLILRRAEAGSSPEKREVPVLHLDHLVLGTRGVTISTDALALCCEQGIPVTIVDWRGRPVGRFSSPALHGTAEVRRAQLSASGNVLGATLARSLVVGKILNQADNLRYFGKNRRTRCPSEYEALSAVADVLVDFGTQAQAVVAVDCKEARGALMGIEAEAARAYWGVIAQTAGRRGSFERREQRGTRCQVNAALNYGYGVLRAEVWNAVVLAGLEPYAGLLHVDRPGRISFVLDLMEEFRPVVVDRTVFGLVAKGWSVRLDENGWLSSGDKRRLLDSLAARWGTRLLHHGKRFALRNILQLQARDAARHVQGKAVHRPLRQRW